MENKKPVENVLEETLKNLKNIIDVDCIIGNPISKDNICVIPVSKVSVGFVSGGGEYNSNKKMKNIINFPFAGGSGGGCNITPIGFLVINNDNINFIKVDSTDSFEKIVNMASNIVDNIKG